MFKITKLATTNRLRIVGFTNNLQPLIGAPTGSDNFSSYSIESNVLKSFPPTTDWNSPLAAIYYGNHRGLDMFTAYPSGSISTLNDQTKWLMFDGVVTRFGPAPATPSIYGFQSETTVSGMTILDVSGVHVNKFSSSFY